MKRIRPHLKSFRLSYRSPQVPAGSINSAVPRMKEVMIQLNSMAVRERSLSMVGNAMFTAEIRKVPVVLKALLFFPFFCSFFCFCVNVGLLQPFGLFSSLCVFAVE